MSNPCDIQGVEFESTSLSASKQQVTFTVKNNTNQQFHDLIVVIPEDSLFYKNTVKVHGYIGAYDEHQFKFVRTLKANCFPKDIPLQYSFKLETMTGKTVAAAVGEVNIATYSIPTMSEFIKLKSFDFEDTPINLMVFGLAGSSKSSFVNSCATMLHVPSTFVSVAQVGAAEHHVTKNVFRYKFENQAFQFVDTWGLTSKNYQDMTLEKMMDGELPFGWEINAEIFNKKEELKQFKSSARYRVIHGLVFVIPVATLEDSGYIAQVKHYFSKLADKVGNPNVLLTLVDTICPDVRKDPLQTYTPVQNYVSKCAKLLNIPENRVFVGVNYTKETKKNAAIDRNNFNTLYNVLLGARSFWTPEKFAQRFGGYQSTSTTNYGFGNVQQKSQSLSKYDDGT